MVRKCAILERVMKGSVKKTVIWGLVLAFIIGSIIVGGPFNMIDIILVRPIVNFLFVIFNLVHDFGVAIIIFTVLVKMMLLPLTKRQIRQTRLMRKLQPELTKIRKNCNGNKQLESLQTMDLYKRYNFKPFTSILTLLIQLPIFIAIFSAIKVIATPLPADNLMNRAYDFVAYDGSEIKILEEKQQVYLDSLVSDVPEDQKVEYDFHPQLFGVINLEAKASDVFSSNGMSGSAIFMLVCAILAAVAQYIATNQQLPSGKSVKSKKFRELIEDAKAGKELSEDDINGITSSQMTKMMPLMMFFIMINLHGALAFYYFLSNMITILQQKIIFRSARDEMDDATDKAILKELKSIQEGEVIENKKTGTKITRISAKDNKKKRRK